MAAKKISALPAVATPASTDEFEVNQGGTSKKETRAQLHALESGEHLVLPQVNEVATPTLAFGDGDTGFFETTANALRVAIAGDAKWRMDGTWFGGAAGNRPAFLQSAPSATVPNIVTEINDPDTGIGRAALDALSLIAGAKEMLRLVETGTATTDQIIIGPAGIIGAAATPSLAWGNGDTGFFEAFDDTLVMSRGGAVAWEFSSILGRNANLGAVFRNVDSSATAPNILPANSDIDTGLGRAGTDALSLIAGAVEAVRLTEVSSHIIQTHEAQVGITANANQSQGDTPLLSTYNVISVVAAATNAVTLPAVFGVGTKIYVKNDDSTDSMNIWPASGDNAGAGADTAVALAAGVGTLFLATTANATWTQMF